MANIDQKNVVDENKDKTQKEITDAKHHHHHHHHNNKKTPGRKIRKFICKYRKRLIGISVIAVFALLLIFLALFLDHKESLSQNEIGNYINTETEAKSIQIEIPLFDEKISLVHPAVTKYLDSENTDPVVKIYNQYIEAGRIDIGVPVEISYKINGMPAGYSVKSSVIEVSELDSFENSRVFSLNSNKNSVYVYFLKTNTLYYYRIKLTLSDDQVISTQGTFTTADTPRILKIDGAYNVRDIGGWDTIYGKEISQGLLYRGTELDGAVEPSYSITSQGLKDMLTVLGIKTDMDLRPASDNENGTDALGMNVEHIYFDAPMYRGVFNETRKESVRKIFSELADKNNYPVYLHCTYGLDRAGTICYLLEALLGMNEEDLLKEYELSAMYHGKVSDEMPNFITAIKELDGSTIQDKVEGYLLSIGVTPAEITSIREIFLGK